MVLDMYRCLAKKRECFLVVFSAEETESTFLLETIINQKWSN